MIIRDKKGTERIAMPYDFQDVTITFTPSEWNELRDIFSFHKKKIKPDVFGKINRQILEKLEANRPALKEDYEKVRDGWLTVASGETVSTPTGVSEAKKYVYGVTDELPATER